MAPSLFSPNIWREIQQTELDYDQENKAALFLMHYKFKYNPTALVPSTAAVDSDSFSDVTVLKSPDSFLQSCSLVMVYNVIFVHLIIIVKYEILESPLFSYLIFKLFFFLICHNH